MIRIACWMGLAVMALAGVDGARAEPSARADAARAAEELAYRLDGVRGALPATPATSVLRGRMLRLADLARTLEWQIEVDAPADQRESTYRAIRSARLELIALARHLDADALGITPAEMEDVRAAFADLSARREALSAP